MVLSVLICTKRERKQHLDMLLAILAPQIKDHPIEVLIDSGPKVLGTKRNDLIKDAQGKYIWFVDDGDFISETAIEDILKCAELDPDVMGISGATTMNGKDAYDWKVRLGHREPDHNTPMLREIAIKVKFTDSLKCDKKWAKELNSREPFKKMEIIEKPIYQRRLVFTTFK